MDILEGIANLSMDKLEWLRETGFLTMYTNVTMIAMMLASLVKDRPFPKTSLTFKDSYDYIIVGGGTAGSVMASRLSQKPCVSVLLLEAGGPPPLISEIPAAVLLLFRSRMDWHYLTEPQKHAGFAQHENRVIWFAGKALGGTSAMNGMFYVRGNRKNYDDWEAEGATGWSYKDVLPYFLKLEDNRDVEKLDPGFHRRGGPMSVERINYVPEIKNPILKATADLGYEERDINGKRQTGVYDLQADFRNQQRCSTAKAYLVPAEDRPNLDIVENAFVTKIVIENKRAIGVEFDYKGERHIVGAKKEVVVSSGSIRTPQLLMLSGIGPRKELQKFNISIVADLPVGKNLQDHNAATMVYQLSYRIPPLFLKYNVRSALDYAFRRKGPFTAPNQCSLLAFLDGLNTTAYSRDFPRQELYFAEYATAGPLLTYNLKDEVFKEVFAPYNFKTLYVCISSLTQPKSRGYITLRSTDPYDYPKIDPNYYHHPSDLRDVVEGMKICQAVAAHPALQKYKARLLDTMYPDCHRFRGDDDRFLTCLALQVIVTFYHSVGTARMGQPDDPRSVVDPQLRVIGVKGLRVINAAVMPIVPSGNTNVPTIMVAEKAYDMMKDDIQCSRKSKVHKHKRGKIRPQY